jgi:hypothetical protein
MDSLAGMIERAQTAKKELIASTVRLAPEDHEFIDDLADDLGVSRQDLLQNLIKAGIREALSLTRLAPDDPEANSANHFHILNTNKRHSIDSHDYMLKEGIAAAYYGDWKLNIDRIRKNDIVFLYENGRGIVAYGCGTGETLTKDADGNADECHYQVLQEFKKLEQPLPASQIRKILGRNVVFLRTMSGAPDGQKLLDWIKAR